MEILGKLFGSPARVKIMRLFLLSMGDGFEAADIAKRTRIKPEAARREISLLGSASFIRQKSMIKDIKDRKGKTKRKKVKGWFLNADFPQLEIFKVLLIGSELMSGEQVASRFKKAGKIKLLAVAGIFIQDKDSRVDLLIVGDSLKRALIDSIVREMESEIGRELVYATFETKEFLYRLNMYDKLVYDILSFPHERVVEAREFSTLPLKKV